MNKTKKGITGLTLGAIGIVFGDIGTSPLYALQAIFGPLGMHLAISQRNVYGIISLIIWSVTIVVSFKYIGYIMRADNEGEGGIMALVALIKSGKLQAQRKWLLILLGIIGVSLFYGDSAITPAISVLSAVEGLKIVSPSLAAYIVPIALTILALLFWIQKTGTGLIGRLFGPVMFVWFMVIAAGGGWQVWQHPDILRALSPWAAANFVISQPALAFVAMGAVVLAITGAEALYADMGHFGRRPIATAWFFLVFPALALCYMGQGALLLHNTSSRISPFFLLYPAFARLLVILLAALATLIASQAVISGAFSLTRQAVQLDFLPKMMIRHTSARETGQIYVPFINVALFVVVVLLILIFGSSQRLAHAYGIAVSGTLAIDTILFLAVMRILWQKSLKVIVLLAIIFLSVDSVFLMSNAPKVLSGGWFPILIACLVLALIYSWLKGQRIVTKERNAQEGTLEDFIKEIRSKNPPLTRLPGQAVYIGHHADLAPLALRATVNELHELHEKAVIVTVQTATSAHIPDEKRAVFDGMKYNDGISHLSLTYGFQDSHNIIKTLSSLRSLSPELDFDPFEASYFVSLSKVVPSGRHNMARWQKSLYCLMARNALSVSDFYKLPIERTVEMRSLIEL